MQDGPLDHLIQMLGSLPGLGHRSARRVALHLLSHRDTAMRPLANMIAQVADDIKDCETCGNLDIRSPCRVCSALRRDHTKICVVAQVSDLWAVERTAVYKGLYHVLGGVLSALDGIGPADLRLESLHRRVESGQVQEVILALPVTVDGQSTAHYIADQLSGSPAQITRLAHGVPVGGELDYLDDGTIMTALKARKSA